LGSHEKNHGLPSKRPKLQQEMLIAAVGAKGVQAQTILFDIWYASAENLKLVHRLGRVFYTAIKRNRRFSLTKEDGYIGHGAGRAGGERRALGYRGTASRIEATDRQRQEPVSHRTVATQSSGLLLSRMALLKSEGYGTGPNVVSGAGRFVPRVLSTYGQNCATRVFALFEVFKRKS
jgi:hypothetical protein